MAVDKSAGEVPDVESLLAAVVAEIGGTPRAGQIKMARAVTKTLEGGPNLLVQAGTGTGKSLGYLVPVVCHLLQNPDDKVVISTATLALQAQLASRDIPTVLEVVRRITGKNISWGVLKGRSNYLCLAKTRSGWMRDDEEAILDLATIAGTEAGSGVGGAVAGSSIAKTSSSGDSSANVKTGSGLASQMLSLISWGEECLASKKIADRDAAPSHRPKVWAQVSVNARECVGAKCEYATECFANHARDQARRSQLIITNHALLAIDAQEPGSMLPAASTIIVDEAHDFAERVFSANTEMLSAPMVERLARQAKAHLDDDLHSELMQTATALETVIAALTPKRITADEEFDPLRLTLTVINDLVREVASTLASASADDLTVQQPAVLAGDLARVSARMLAGATSEVVWLDNRGVLYVAPLSVADLIHDGLFANYQMVLTSATLLVNGTFEALGKSLGLRLDDEFPWRGIDVGTPFDYQNQGLLYVSTNLPAVRRDGIPREVLEEVAELVWAAGGRTLGLFSSQRAAELAAAHCRNALPKFTILCQGEARLDELQRRFIAEPESSLFGTLSLWQGIDAPGDTCRMVIIDKIPFPRPDDPLMQARQEAVQRAGGNGFMQVAAVHAALLLTQGMGRLIRSHDDEGVVAVLDPRLITARYGSFLRKSLPPFKITSDREEAVARLQDISVRAAGR